MVSEFDKSILHLRTLIAQKRAELIEKQTDNPGTILIESEKVPEVIVAEEAPEKILTIVTEKKGSLFKSWFKKWKGGE
ncbi:MAG: hypothetical protein K0Q87_4634 [Neobacillus sp.]|jgi:hypothetical protein|nr:hypothetical protein [Neobacillus sp.]MDF2858783.1 hypothetical protein [Neobacillus sp.]